eukprot:2389034-Pleurochrysis_carterae.AAC.1
MEVEPANGVCERESAHASAAPSEAASASPAETQPKRGASDRYEGGGAAAGSAVAPGGLQLQLPSTPCFASSGDEEQSALDDDDRKVACIPSACFKAAPVVQSWRCFLCWSMRFH